jgi:hypothetical protein
MAERGTRKPNFHNPIRKINSESIGQSTSKRLRTEDVAAGSYFQQLLEMMQHADWILRMLSKRNSESALDGKRGKSAQTDHHVRLMNLFYKDGQKQDMGVVDASEFGITDATPWCDIFELMCKKTAVSVSNRWLLSNSRSRRYMSVLDEVGKEPLNYFDCFSASRFVSESILRIRKAYGGWRRFKRSMLFHQYRTHGIFE